MIAPSSFQPFYRISRWYRLLFRVVEKGFRGSPSEKLGYAADIEMDMEMWITSTFGDQ